MCDLRLKADLGSAEALANSIPQRKRWDSVELSISLVQGVQPANGARLDLIHSPAFA